MEIFAQTILTRTLLSVVGTLLLTIPHQVQEAIITGEVIDGEGQPVWGASLRITPSNQTTITNQHGQFLFRQLDNRYYRISVVSAPGYYEEENARDRTAGYRPGEAVTIRLNKGGVITGRVTNESGDPLVRIRVRAFRVRDDKGKLVKGGEAYNRDSDDRGMYRLFGLKPGAYLVSAEDSKLGFYLPSAYRFNTPNWYPSGARETAVEVSVAASSVTENINILFRARQGYIVSGTVTVKNSTSEMFLSVNLIDRYSGMFLQTTGLYGEHNGFAFHGVANGEYEIEAEASGQPSQSRMISPRQRVKIDGRDISGLQLSLSSLGLIRGKIVVEPLSKGSCSQPFALSELSLEATKESQGEDQRFTRAEAVPDPQGVFTLYNLVAGLYRLNLGGLGDRWYNKESSGVLDDSGLVPVGTTGKNQELVITLASDGATLAGKTATRSQVYLIQAGPSARLKITQVRMVRTQADGAFVVRHLAPGSYRALSHVIKGDEEEKDILIEELSQLKKEADRRGILIELKSCQQLTGVKLP